jgi:hypothetical protein
MFGELTGKEGSIAGFGIQSVQGEVTPLVKRSNA